MVLAQRNLAWSRARGGFEIGARHYPVMVLLHVGLLVGCVVEVAVMDRPSLDDRSSFHHPQRCSDEHPYIRRELSASEAFMNDLLVAGAGPEGLTPHTLRHLDAIGITPHGRPFRGITYLDRTQR